MWHCAPCPIANPPQWHSGNQPSDRGAAINTTTSGMLTSVKEKFNKLSGFVSLQLGEHGCRFKNDAPGFPVFRLIGIIRTKLGSSEECRFAALRGRARR
jgi:hypothetical protein